MKALRSLFWVITAQSYFLFSQAGAIDNEASPIFQSWGDVLSPASHPDIDSWKARRQIASISSINGTSNSTLSATERIVKEAQEEARIRNKFLVEHPRKNNYAFRNFPIANNKDNATGTGVNKSVSDAAALITDYLSRNGSVKPTLAERQTSSYWMENINQNYGKSPYVSNQTYKVWRNVHDYGAKGDGTTDDTAAINAAIQDGNRCGQACGSTSVLQAVVYFPSGTYLVSASLVQYFFTQFIGNPLNPPTIKASAGFVGLGMISSDAYIDGGDGSEWYINQSNFFRQVRNFVLDISAAPLQAYVAAIHWQVAQATSLQNIKFVMSTVAGNNQQGIFMENGSGGFMSDLTFSGGALGAYVGNQQFTVRNLKFSNHQVHAIEIHWDWGWTWKGITIDNCPVGVFMSTPATFTEVGSAIFIDSTITNCPIGFNLQTGAPNATITLSLFSLSTTNVPAIVQYIGGATKLAGSSGTVSVPSWGLGKRYDTSNGEASGVWQNGTAFPNFPTISPMLLKSPTNQQSGFFERSKPQYETVPLANFINVKLAPYNAVGNGVSDDTSAFNRALAAVAGTANILWIPAGVYLVTDTVFIPSGTKLVGQSWAQIMGSGVKFQNANAPYPVIKVGNVGDVGNVEIQDLLFTVRGPAAGAVILEWNIHEASQGSAAMWDTHIRVGGALGSNLQLANCPKLSGTVKPACIGASLLVHITAQASAYFENNWFWVADHDLDVPTQDQIDIYVGRGVLIESAGPVLFYGGASEHSVMYQYQTVNAANIFLGMIQTESPYYQVAPAAPAPFTPSTVLASDPTFSYCNSTSASCAISWAVRIVESKSIYIYGAGLYSWFQKYSQACLVTENCQDRIFEIESSSAIWIYSLITKASVEMISPDGGLSVLAANNQINFCAVVMAWLGSAGNGTDTGNPNGLKYLSPASATVIPFPQTTITYTASGGNPASTVTIAGSSVGPTATFTVGGPVVTIINVVPNNGNQNVPVGPGPAQCPNCDLARLITSTCCGTDGGVSNPLEISPNTPIPRQLILPAGFIPNQAIPDVNGITWPAGKPIPQEVIIPEGTTFNFPFEIPPGLGLSNTDTPGSDQNNGANGTMYIITTFWMGPGYTVYCTFPCTILFPPITSTTTWTPVPFWFTLSGSSTLITPPVQTSELVRISKTTVSSSSGSSPTFVIAPIPALKPLCFKITIPFLGTITIGICPPDWSPFPPTIPIPKVTIVPVPPGGKTGPINPGNIPSAEQVEEEQEEDEEEEGDQDHPVCPWNAYDGTPEDPYLDEWLEWFPYTGPALIGGGSPTIGAGTGSPVTVTATATVTATTEVTVGVTSTVLVSGSPPVQSPASPSNPPVSNPDTEVLTCYAAGGLGVEAYDIQYEVMMPTFCMLAEGETIKGGANLPIVDRVIAMRGPGSYNGIDRSVQIVMSIVAKNGCSIQINKLECERIMGRMNDCFGTNNGGYSVGGYVDGNCAQWTAVGVQGLSWNCNSLPYGDYCFGGLNIQLQ